MIGTSVKREGINGDEEIYGESIASRRNERFAFLRNHKTSLDWVKMVAKNNKSLLETQQKISKMMLKGNFELKW